MTWATALVLFKMTGEHVPPLALNLFKCLVALILLVATLIVMGEGFEVLDNFERGDLYILMLSGFLGIALADTVFFHSLNLVGVGIVSIVDCSYSPMIILFSVLLLNEELVIWHYVGTALILGGVLLASGHAPPPNRTKLQLIVGILLGILAIVLMAFGIVLAKPVLDDFPLIWATTLRLSVGTVVLALIALGSPRRKVYWAAMRPSAIWKISLPASVLGTYFAMVFWVGGFKYTDASVAGILNQTSIIFAIILAAMILKEKFTKRKFVAVTLAFSGVVIVFLADSLMGLVSGV